VQRADQIAVVADACISEIGTHEELIALGGHYALLAATWNQTQPH
jgi:ABC-type multidrug transport system fused ATPase/permease subunit